MPSFLRASSDILEGSHRGSHTTVTLASFTPGTDIALAFAWGVLYSLPIVFGEAPAVQLSAGKSTVKLTMDDVLDMVSPIKNKI